LTIRQRRVFREETMVIRRKVFGREPASTPAFTLVELLVTITVIAILAALLLSALSSAMLHAQRIQCLSNVRQLEMIGLMYASDNRKYPPYHDANFPGAGAWMGTLMVTVKEKGIGVCPTAPGRPPVPSRGNGQGTVDKAWVRWTSDDQTMFFGSYGFNSWLYTHPTSWRPDKQRFLFNGEANIQVPGRTPVFCDANWVDGDPMEHAGPYYDLYAGSPLVSWEDNMGRFAIPRHGGVRAASAPRNITAGSKLPGAISIGLADGHAELAPLKSLWDYSWHLDWQAPAVPPPPVGHLP
jgi:prepilin-type N-terminal cleavage/methylation domain-containing protein